MNLGCVYKEEEQQISANYEVEITLHCSLVEEKDAGGNSSFRQQQRWQMN